MPEVEVPGLEQPVVETQAETAQEVPQYITDFRADLQSYVYGIGLLICILIGVILAHFVWQGD